MPLEANDIVYRKLCLSIPVSSGYRRSDGTLFIYLFYLIRHMVAYSKIYNEHKS